MERKKARELLEYSAPSSDQKKKKKRVEQKSGVSNTATTEVDVEAIKTKFNKRKSEESNTVSDFVANVAPKKKKRRTSE